MYKNIIFDADGTLINSFEGIKSSINYALQKLGEPIASDEVLRKFVGPSLMDSFRLHMGFSEEKCRKAIEFYREDYVVNGVYKCCFYDGMDELLDKLKLDGKILSVATSKPQKFIDIILKSKGYYDHFDIVAGADESDSHSDKKDLVKKAILSSPAIMIGDRYFDIEASKINGIDSIGVLYGFCEDGEFEKYRPTYIAEKVSDIYDIVTKKN